MKTLQKTLLTQAFTALTGFAHSAHSAYSHLDPKIAQIAGISCIYAVIVVSEHCRKLCMFPVYIFGQKIWWCKILEKYYACEKIIENSK